MQMSFGSMEMDARIRRESALMKAHVLIDWEGLRPQLVGLYKREASRGGGQEPIDPLVMFKAVLLGQWHNLSDPKLEEGFREAARTEWRERLRSLEAVVKPLADAERTRE